MIARVVVPSLERLRRVGVALLAAVAAVCAPDARAAVTLTHVHGLAFSADGKRLMIPSHHGLAVYENGKWSKVPGPQHDYMGFSATATRLYSSGHPATASNHVNPFGLIRSGDGGKTWDKLGLQGETDFHLLAASWNTNAVYVWNPAPSSRIRKLGLHYTLNDGFVWKPTSAKGLQGEARLAIAPLQEGAMTPVRPPPIKRDDAVAFIAQNPANRSLYAIATFRRDVYLTKDGGRTWTTIAENGESR